MVNCKKKLNKVSGIKVLRVCDKTTEINPTVRGNELGDREVSDKKYKKIYYQRIK